VDEIVIATPKNEADDALIALADRLEIGHYQGSEENVMQRVLEAGEKYEAEIICEVTGDCPIIDPELIQQLIETFMVNPVVYANNGRGGLPDGMGAQVFYRNALKKSHQMTNAPLDLEHVTLHIRQNRDVFPALYLVALQSLHWPELGITLDEEDDYLLLKKIIEYFSETNSMFGCLDVIRLLKMHPDWVDINKHVKRKGTF
jgi:spore coat polysaccharide biosynthesis protein SpsF